MSGFPPRLSLVFALIGSASFIPALAQYSNQYSSQNQYQNQGSQYGYQRSGPPGGPLPEPSTVHVSDSTLQLRRWENEWREQHPGEPVPNMGILQKMHRGETSAQIQARGQQMWANRQADLRRNYSMAKQMQERTNTANHVTWNAQQWAAWDKQYDGDQQAQANAYREGVRLSGEMARDEAFYQQNGYHPVAHP